MRSVRSRDTGPELKVRKIVYSLGFRYRLHQRDLPGAPDITFRPIKKIIFVHGCFWHGHSCKRGARIPKTNRDYWIKKISGNFERDKKHKAKLKKLGWRVLVIWECQIKNTKTLEGRISHFLTS